MTKSAPVERVVDFLSHAGFRILPSPLIINQSKFHFPAAMIGPEGASDIVLIGDTVEEKDAELVRRIQAVARALDLARSRNPLTAVLVGPRPNPGHLAQIMQVCRALPVGTISSQDVDADMLLSKWLAVLTPLDQVDTDGVVADPMEELMARLEGLSEEIAGLTVHAAEGADAVEVAANALLEDRLSVAVEEGT